MSDTDAVGSARRTSPSGRDRPQAQGMLSAQGRVPVSRAVKVETSGLRYVLSDPAVVLDENQKWEQLWDRLFMKK